MSKVFVTGGNGFIGSHIVRALLESGCRVTCLVRPGSDQAALAGLDLDILTGPLVETAALALQMAGHDAVIHNASKAGDWGPYAEFYQSNVVNTQNVINACVQSGIRQVILTGSCSVYGEEHHPQPKDEESGWNSHYPYFLHRVFPCGMNYYRDTKKLGQQAAIRIARAHGLNLTVIDPVWVYGERERTTGFYEYLKSVSEGMSVMPGSSRNNFHVIYAGDLARLYVLALQKNLPGVEKIIAGNPRPQNMRHIYAEFCRAAGVKPPALLPRWIFYPAGFLLELLATLTGSKKPPLLTRGRVNMFYDSIAYNPEKARRLLGFTASTPLEEGVRRTVDWYRKNGWLKEKP